MPKNMETVRKIIIPKGVKANNPGEKRDQQIIKTSMVGIITNLLLALFKAITGLLANSITVILDAVNNFSDALSSVITIVGTRLASKTANKKHPFGYGRIEYMTTMIIACIILFAGGSSFIEAVKKIFHPQIADYSIVTIIVIVVAVVVKLILGYYVKKVGKKLNADALIASGADATLDAIISISTLLGAFMTIIWKITLDGWLGAIISIVIIKAGLEMLMGALDNILGQRIDSSLSKNIKEDVISHQGVLGVYDLLLHSYGPSRMLGSIHIEIYDYVTAGKIQELSRQIQTDIYLKYGCFLTIGIYAVNTLDDDSARMQNEIFKIAYSHKGILQVHAFYVNINARIITFDIIFDFVLENPIALRDIIMAELTELYPEYNFDIQIDIDYSD